MKSTPYKTIHRRTYDGVVTSTTNTAATRALISARFKVLCADAGLSIDQAAELLHVTPRTIRYWFSGKTWVPYTAYKLLRVMRYFELPGKEWRGWHFHSGKLWTPEGHGFAPQDSSWWSLLVRRSHAFKTLYDRESAFNRAMRAGWPDAPARPAKAVGSPSGRGELVEPTGKAGGAAQPPRPNLLLEHFRTEVGNKGGLSLEKPPQTLAWLIAHGIPHREKQGVES